MHIGALWRIRLNHPCAAAMRSCVKLLWTLVSEYPHKKTMQPHQRTSPRRQISVNSYTCKQYRIHLQSIIITINQSLKLFIRLITECICVNSSSSASTPNTVDALRFVHSTWTKLNWTELNSSSKRTQKLSTNSPGFDAANHVVTLMRVTNQRVVYLGRLVAGQQFRSIQLCYCAVNKRLRVLVYHITN